MNPENVLKPTELPKEDIDVSQLQNIKTDYAPEIAYAPPEEVKQVDKQKAVSVSLVNSLATGGNPVEMYERIIRESDAYGQSTSFDEARRKVIEDRVNELNVFAKSVLVDNSIPVEERYQKLQYIQKNIGDTVRGQINIKDRIAELALASNPTASEVMLQNFDAAKTSLNLMQAQYLGMLEKSGVTAIAEAGIGGVVGAYKSEEAKERGEKFMFDLIPSMIPGNYSYAYAELYREVFPKGKRDITKYPAGEAAKAILDELKTLSYEEQTKAFGNVIRWAESNSGYIGENKLNTVSLIGSIASEYVMGEIDEGVDWSRVIDNVTSALDAIPVVGAAVVGARGVIKGFGILPTLNAANKQMAAQAAAIAAQNPQVAAGLGVTRQDIIREITLPTTPGSVQVAGPSTNDIEWLSIMESGVNFTGDQKALIQAAHIKKLEDQKFSGAAYNSTASQIVHEDYTSFTVSGVYGRAENTAFSNPLTARFTGEEMFGKDAPIEVLEEVNGVLQPVGNTPLSGQYYFSVNQRYGYNSDVANAAKLVLPVNTAETLFRSPYFIPADSLFDGKAAHFVDSASVSLRNQVAIEDNVARTYYRPFVKMNKVGRKKVYDKLQEASDAERWHTIGDLKAAGFSDKELYAYDQIAKSSDLKYVASNNKSYRLRQSEGYQTVYDAVNDVSYTAKSYANSGTAKAQMAGKEVDVDGTVVGMDGNAIDALYANGGNVYRAVDGSLYGVGKSSRVFVAKPLEREQLPYVPGYFTRIYEDNFIVRALDKATGKSVAVASARSRTAAEDTVSQLPTTNMEYVITPKRELLRGEMDESALAEEILSQNRLIFGKRGQRLIGSEIKNPLEAMLEHTSMLARMGGITENIKVKKEQFLNTYGPKIGLASDGAGGYVYPASKTELQNYISNSGIDPKSKEAKDAYNFYGYIDRLSGTEDILGWTNAMRWVMENANYFSRFPVVENVLTDIGAGKYAITRNPLAVLRNFNFVTMLALNPQRQAWLQAGQSLYIAAVAPQNWAMSIPKGFAMFSAYAQANKKGMQWVQQNGHWHRWAGMDKAEFDKMVEAFKHSGELNAVDLHDMAKDTVRAYADYTSASPIMKPLVALGNTGKAAVSLSRNVGFDLGEKINRTMSWQMAYEKIKSVEDISKMSVRELSDKVTALSARYTLLMDRSGSMAYSKGWLSLSTQFMQMQHKAAMAYLPKTLGGSTTFTGGEKFRIAVAQLGMFGLQGLNLVPLWNKAEEQFGVAVDDETRKWITGGLFDRVAYEFIGDVLLSESLAPAGGANTFTTPFGAGMKLIEAIANSEGTDLLEEANLSMVLGPTVTSTSRVAQALSSTMMMFHTKEITKEQFNSFLMDWGSIASGFSNAMKSQLAVNTNMLWSSKFKPITEVSDAQAKAKAFGISSPIEKAYMEFMDSTSSGNLGIDKKETYEGDAKYLVQEMAKWMIRQGYIVDPIVGDEGQEYRAHELNWKIYNRAAEHVNYLMSSLEKTEAFKLKTEFEKAFKSYAKSSEDTAEAKMITSLVKLIGNGFDSKDKATGQLSRVCRASQNRAQCESVMNLALENAEASKEGLESLDPTLQLIKNVEGNK